MNLAIANPFLLTAHPLVHVNASLNALATVLLVLGLFFIKQGKEDAHRRTMLSAFGVSVIFLACYLAYHILLVGHVKFTHGGVVRTIYYIILSTHILLAMLVPFLAIVTIYFGYQALKTSDSVYRKKHARLAKITFPIWLYVSVTGVIVYVMLYHLWPAVPELVKI